VAGYHPSTKGKILKRENSQNAMTEHGHDLIAHCHGETSRTCRSSQEFDKEAACQVACRGPGRSGPVNNARFLEVVGYLRKFRRFLPKK